MRELVVRGLRQRPLVAPSVESSETASSTGTMALTTDRFAEAFAALDADSFGPLVANKFRFHDSFFDFEAEGKRDALPCVERAVRALAKAGGTARLMSSPTVQGGAREYGFALTKSPFHSGKDGTIVLRLIARHGEVVEAAIGAFDGETTDTVLNLELTNASELPQRISRMNRLEEINFERNAVSLIPSDIGCLRGLKVLLGGYNVVPSVPTSIGELHNLHLLRLCHNNLTSIPHEIGRCKALHYTYFNDNTIQTVPNSLCKLTALQELYLHNNAISSMQSLHIRGLSKLRVLWICGNNMTGMPFDVADLDNLHEANLSEGNPGGAEARWLATCQAVREKRITVDGTSMHIKAPHI